MGPPGELLRIPQADDHPIILEGHPRLVDADHAEGAAQQTERVAHLQAHHLRRLAANDDLTVGYERLPFYDLEVADSVLARVVTHDEEHGHLLQAVKGKANARDRLDIEQRG